MFSDGSFDDGFFDLNGDGLLDIAEEFMAYNLITEEDDDAEETWDDYEDDNLDAV